METPLTEFYLAIYRKWRRQYRLFWRPSLAETFVSYRRFRVFLERGELIYADFITHKGKVISQYGFTTPEKQTLYRIRVAVI